MRIIAGKHRGRKLQCPKDVTRPTLDRVREALFSILGPLDGYQVVDFFSGSGALGFEALSRGARHALLVESDRQAAGVIRKNAAALGLGSDWEVLECSVDRARGALRRRAPIDLVLADPPWRIAAEALLMVDSAVAGLLAPEATVVVGHAARDTLELPDDAHLTFERCRRWGDSALSFFSQSE